MTIYPTSQPRFDESQQNDPGGYEGYQPQPDYAYQPSTCQDQPYQPQFDQSQASVSNYHPQNGPPAGKQPRKGRLLLATLLVLGAAGGTAAVYGFKDSAISGHAPLTMTVRGTLSLAQDDDDPNYTSDGDSCEGTGGYSDISPGAVVKVHNAQDVVLTSASLGDGTDTGDECVFPFVVAGVPRGSTTYEVEISHRGELAETPQEMEAGLAFTLGDD